MNNPFMEISVSVVGPRVHPAYTNPAYILQPMITNEPLLVTNSTTNNSYYKHCSHMCPRCNGSKKILVTGTELCKKCPGIGRDTKSNLWSQPCGTCRGLGVVAYTRHELCTRCNGIGTVHY